MRSLDKGRSRPKVYTVSRLNRRIKDLLEKNFPLVWVEGEVSNLRRPSSGHLYFTLKDESSQLPAVIFRSAASALRFQLEDGLKAVVRGRLSVYTVRGQYQLIANLVQPVGVGELQLALEQLKKKLAAEGLFDPRLKRPLPLLPRKIGLVTSPTGAAIRDILQVIDRRFGNVHLIINPVRVQGEGSAEEIARAIDEFNRMEDIDVLIVTRGGGSLEDLWAFNEEAVARSIHRSRIPVISAVGHQIDWTISDLAADLRAPTPSAAAELVVERKDELEERIIGYLKRIRTNWKYVSDSARARIDEILKSYLFRDPARLLQPYQQRLDELVSLPPRIIRHRLQLQRERFKSCRARLGSLNPLAILSRGYSFTTRAKDGKIVTNVRSLRPGSEVKTRLHRGSFTSVVKKIEA